LVIINDGCARVAQKKSLKKISFGRRPLPLLLCTYRGST
jgi:hypothetical protein